jgi:sodium transport system permease protein
MKLFIIFKKELIDQVRDKRTIIAAILMPAVLVPLLLFLMMHNTAKQELTAPVRIVMEKDEVLRSVIISSFDDAIFIQSDSPSAAIKNGEADLGIEMTKSGGQYSTLTFFYDSARMTSALAYGKIYGIVKTHFGGPDTLSKGTQISSFTVRDEKESKTLITLSVILPVFLIVFAASSSMSSVIDMSSGEKERGTIETLISCNISRGTIIAGKILAASAVGITAVLSLVSGLTVCSHFFPRITGGISLLEFSGAGNILLMLFLTCISVLLFSAAGMAIGLYAKSVKEGTILTLPVIVMSSAVSGGLIGGDPFSMNGLYFLIPLVNSSFVIRSIIYGRLNLGAFIVTVLVNLSYAFLFLVVSGGLLKKETVISRS